MFDKFSKKLPTVKQLQYFLAVYEERNFTKAAGKLCITQPSLTAQIQSLEANLGVSLFLRNTQYVLPTNAAEQLRESAESVLNHLTVLSSCFQHVSSKKFSLGLTKTLNFDTIPIIKQFIDIFADEVEIYQNRQTSQELLHEVMLSHLDFALVSDYYTGENTAELEKILIHQEPLVVAIASDYTVSRDEIDLNEIASLPLYWFQRHQNPLFYDQCEIVFKSLKQNIVRIQELSDSLAMLLQVAQGNAFLLMPESMAKAIVQGITYKRLSPEFEQSLLIDIYLIWKGGDLSEEKSHVIGYFSERLPRK